MDINKISEKILYQNLFLTPVKNKFKCHFYCLGFFKNEFRFGSLCEDIFIYKNGQINYYKNLPLLTLDNLKIIYNIYPNKYNFQILPKKANNIVIQYFDTNRNRTDFATFSVENYKLKITNNKKYIDTGYITNHDNTSQYQKISWCFYNELYQFIKQLHK